MKAKFETKNALSERMLFNKPKMLALIYLGIVLFACAIIIGVTMMVIGSIAVGAVIMTAFLIVGIFSVSVGATATTKIIKSNTLTVNSTLKVTTIFDDRVEEVNECPTARDTREIGYEYVTAVGFQGGIFYFALTDNSYIIAHEDSLAEGSIDELREFLRSKFGDKYKDKMSKKKRGAAKKPTEDVESNAISADGGVDNGAQIQAANVVDNAISEKVEQNVGGEKVEQNVAKE